MKSPHLIIEVLSPGTEAFDRGLKFERYQARASVQEYVLVSTERRTVEVFNRRGKLWVYQLYRANQQFDLTNLDLHLTMDDLYRNPSAKAPAFQPGDEALCLV
ncbi:MAG TPA: Uma2 family endonuclease [Ktedonobacteraceae bacterium]|nr:Uma2 family endonuclease [Ktedonobacteraceae bacterium]